MVYFPNNFDDEIKRIKELQFNCVSNEDINSLANAAKLMSDYDQIKAISRVQDLLTTI